jgi:hypothetical protein
MSRKRRRFIPFSQEQFDMEGKVINIHDCFSHIFAVHEESKGESEEKDNEEKECITENYTGPDATQNSASLHALSASDAAVLQDTNAGTDLDPILSALSKLEQSINDRYSDLNDKFQQVNTKLEEINNKITILNEKVDSILSIANDLHTTSPTINDAAPDTPAKTKRVPFESMLQTWQSYCKDNNTTIIPKNETKLSGWIRDTRKAYKQYINNKPSTMTKEREELLKAANFPFNYPTSTDRPSEKKTKSTHH